MSIDDMFAASGGVATTREHAVRAGRLIRIRRGIYALRPPDVPAKLVALDLASRTRVVACMQTAAEMYGTGLDGR